MKSLTLQSTRLACILCLLALALATALPAAQAQRSPRRDRDAHAARKLDQAEKSQAHAGAATGHHALASLLDSLDLSIEQRRQIGEITKQARLVERSRREADDNSATPPTPAERTAARARRQTISEQIRAVLTPEQRQQLDQRQAERRATAEAARIAAKARRAELAPMQQELRTLRREKVLPEIRAQRTAFDRQLSNDERTQIASLRTALQQERASAKTKNPSLAPSNEAAEAQREEKHSRRQAFRETHAKEFAAIATMAQRHMQELNTVRDNIRQLEQALQPEVDAIYAKYLRTEELAVYQERRDRRHSHAETEPDAGDHQPVKSNSGKATPPHRTHGDADRSSHRAVAFLLLDPRHPSSDDSDEDHDLESSPAFGDEETDSKLKVYPNPSAAETQLVYQVRQSGPVLIELLDVNGRVLQTLINETQAAGAYTTTFYPTAQAAPASLVRVTDAQGVQTQLLVTPDR